jgi:hypothetical protein
MMSGNHISYRRIYQKFDEYLSEALGYLGNIILLVWMISWIYNWFGSRRFLSERFFMRNKVIKSLLKKTISKRKGPRTSRMDKSKEKRDNHSLYGPSASEESGPAKRSNTLQMEMKSIDEAVNSNIDVGSKDLCQKYKKNEYTIFFIEYLLNIFKQCCRLKTSKRYNLFKSTESFYNYYMDISKYLRTMIEFEIIKSIVLTTQKRVFLNKFRPYLKRKYSQMYEKKLKELYEDHISGEDMDKMITGINHLKTNSSSASLLNKFI